MFRTLPLHSQIQVLHNHIGWQEVSKATFNSIKENYEPQDGGDDIAGLLKNRLDKLSKLAN